MKEDKNNGGTRQSESAQQNMTVAADTTPTGQKTCESETLEGDNVSYNH